MHTAVFEEVIRSVGAKFNINIKRVVIWTDGCQAHYKGRRNFVHLATAFSAVFRSDLPANPKDPKERPEASLAGHEFVNLHLESSAQDAIDHCKEGDNGIVTDRTGL